jgi:hypothetical protein
MKKNKNIFPNRDEPEAYYDLFTQYIKLCKVTNQEFIKLEKDKIVNEQNNCLWSTYTHELTHWFDHTVTLWGQKNLQLLYNALNARALNNDKEFWRIKYFDDYCKTESLQEYYTSIDKPDFSLKKDRWYLDKYFGIRFGLTGKANDQSPMFFVKFRDSNDEQIARIPITVASLLECRAIHNEFTLRLDNIVSYYEETKKDIGKMKLNRDFYNIIYDPQSLIYSVVGYITMFKCAMSDLNKIYNLSSIIANISLNFPESLIKSIKRIEREGLEIEKYYDKLIDKCDRGFIFYTLLENCKDLNFNKDVNIDEILKCSNLPEEKIFKEFVVEEMQLSKKSLLDGPFKKDFERTVSKGIEIFSKSNLDDIVLKYIQFTDEVFCPKIMYKDTDPELFSISSSDTIETLALKENKSFEENYILYKEMESRFDLFVNSCGL